MSQNKQPAQPEKRTLFKTALAAGAIGVAGYFAGKKQGEAAAETQNQIQEEATFIRSTYLCKQKHFITLQAACNA